MCGDWALAPAAVVLPFPLRPLLALMIRTIFPMRERIWTAKLEMFYSQ